MIRVEALERRFMSSWGEIVALNTISLIIERGRFLVVVGPSGCGKSTLLGLIGCLDQPTNGRLRVGDRWHDGHPDDLDDVRRGLVGFLFQDAGLIDRMSVLENVMMPLEYRGYTRQEASGLAKEAIALVGLAERESACSNVLSGGERQRVGIARLLATKARLIICDEPTASLDEKSTLDILRLLRNAADEGACVICASHDPLVIAHADERIHMTRGSIVEKVGGVD